MAIGIDKFRSLAGGLTQASIKIDSSKSKGDNIELKTFGAGKSMIGRAVRNSEGFFSKIYSFFHDPSGRQNRTIREEFVSAYKLEFPKFEALVDQHVRIDSKKPLNAGLVIQLIRMAEAPEPNKNITYEDSGPVNHSRFQNAYQVKESFDRFVQDSGFDATGSRLLQLLGDPGSVMGREVPDFANLSKLAQGFRIAKEIGKHGNVGDLLKIVSTQHSPAVERVDQDPGSDPFPVKLGLNTLWDAVPEPIQEVLARNYDFMSVAGGLDLQSLNDYCGDLMKAVMSNDPNKVKMAGEDILNLTQRYVGAVTMFIDLLGTPEMRQMFIEQGVGPGKQGPLNGQNTYHQLMNGLDRIRTQMMNPEGGFHGIIALGMVAKGAPDYAIDKLTDAVVSALPEVRENQLEPEVPIPPENQLKEINLEIGKRKDAPQQLIRELTGISNKFEKDIKENEETSEDTTEVDEREKKLAKDKLPTEIKELVLDFDDEDISSVSTIDLGKPLKFTTIPTSNDLQMDESDDDDESLDFEGTKSNTIASEKTENTTQNTAPVKPQVTKEESETDDGDVVTDKDATQIELSSTSEETSEDTSDWGKNAGRLIEEMSTDESSETTKRG